MKPTLYSVIVAAVLLSAFVSSALAVENASVVIRDPSRLVSGPDHPIAPTTDGNRAAYTGTIRLQVVERVSRWRDSQSHTYDFGLLDYALIDGFTVADGATWETEATWNSVLHGMGSIAENNIMVQAVVFNPDPHAQFSDPPYGGPYTAYYSDAAAEASVGAPGFNSTAGGSSHTVFVEEATATW